MTHLLCHLQGQGPFLLTCLLRGMTILNIITDCWNWVSTHMPLARHDSHKLPLNAITAVSTHMPLARHDFLGLAIGLCQIGVSTHMPLARHDDVLSLVLCMLHVSTHMPLARHDKNGHCATWMKNMFLLTCLLRGMTALLIQSCHGDVCFYSHASCEA